MKRFQRSDSKVIDPVHDIDYSSRYDDICLGNKREHKCQCNWLAEKLRKEIELCSHDVVKLERLEEQYISDRDAAQEDGNIACFMRYNTATQHIKVLLDSMYCKHRPVGSDGKQK